MESKLGWITVIVLVLNKISFTSSRTIQTGTFQNLHRHPKLRSCADKVLKENLYVGGRVHMLTGECEGLNRSWVFNQTLQNGYAYTKKVSVKESQSPPVENRYIGFTIPDRYIGFTIPGVLREGATVAVELEAPPDLYRFHIFFIDWEDPKIIESSVVRERIENMPDVTKFKFAEMKRSTTSFLDDVVYTVPQITKGMKRKISFRAHTGSLELLVDDHTISMVNTTVDLTALRMILVAADVLHGVEFIDA